MEFVDRAIAALAARQHGVVTRLQLLDLGLSDSGIDRRLAVGRLHPVMRGVFAVGHPRLTREGRWMAAVLVSGPGAVLSHRSAGALWGIAEDGPRIDVTAPRSRGQRARVRVHHVPIAGDETTTRHGIPVTGVARTLADLAAVLDRRRLARAFREAEYRRLTDRLRVVDVLRRYPRRRGAPALREALERYRPDEVLKSDFEEAFAEFVERHDLPRPETNVTVAGHERDCVWRERRLIVELDGRGAHLTKSAFERDRERDRAAVLAGWRIVRITWLQFHGQPKALAADLRELTS